MLTDLERRVVNLHDQGRNWVEISKLVGKPRTTVQEAYEDAQDKLIEAKARAKAVAPPVRKARPVTRMLPRMKKEKPASFPMPFPEADLTVLGISEDRKYLRVHTHCCDTTFVAKVETIDKRIRYGWIHCYVCNRKHQPLQKVRTHAHAG